MRFRHQHFQSLQSSIQTTTSYKTFRKMHTMHRPRRQQWHLDQNKATDTKSDDKRGGPSTLDELSLDVVHLDNNFLLLNKGPDVRLDGKFDATIEKALHRDFPDIPKFRWIHQLDFATSGALCIGLNKQSTSFGCSLFRDKRVQKEYLALVHGHLPFHPTPSPTSTCAYSKLQQFILDMEEFEKSSRSSRGLDTHRKIRGYPRGPRSARSIFYMEKVHLERDVSNREMSREEEEILSCKKFQFLPSSIRERYEQEQQRDHDRFDREFEAFLGSLKDKRIQEREYHKSEEEEPLAYIFTDPIVELSRQNTFLMAVAANGTDVDGVRGKASTTIAFVLGHGEMNGQKVSKVLLRPLNGRRHQLRLHLAHNGHPIVGDATYGKDDAADRMMLHAWKLWLNPPDDKKERYGNLMYTTPDPFQSIVPSDRDIQTISFST